MTKEELEKEAAEFEESNTVYQAAKREDGTDYAKKVCKVTIKEAYLAGAEPREKRIAELEKENAKLKAQIEKMKCCENCKHHCFWGNELNCKTLSYDEELECMKTKNKWELVGHTVKVWNGKTQS